MQIIDSAYISNNQHHNISKILLERTPLFINSYGISNLSTASFRGLPSSHTLFLWNDIPLNSIMLGMSDLNNINLPVNSEVDILYGSQIQNNSVFGANINVKTSKFFQNNLSIAESFGSFSKFSKIIAANFKINNFISKSQISFNTAKNDFTYINNSKIDSPMEKAKNSELQNFSILQEFYNNFTKNTELSIKANYSKTNRNLPPLITQTENKEKQEDQTFITAINIENKGKYFITNFKSAVIYNFMNYQNITSSINSDNKTLEFINNISVDSKLNNIFYIRGILDNDYIQAISNNYEDKKSMSSSSLFAEITSNFKKMKIATSIKQAIVKDKMQPIDYKLLIMYNLQKNISISSSFSNTHKLPNFNDLYWSPGGNPDLYNEQCYSTDFNINYLHKTDKFYFKTIVSAYYNDANNLIVWQPTEYSYWQANNLKNVISKGIEINLESKRTFKLAEITIFANYSYCSATDNSNKNEQKQLIYIPYHNANTTLQMKKNNYMFSYSQIYCGNRFITSNNTWELPYYTIANIFFSKVFYFKKEKLTLQLEVNNLFNWNYQAIAYHPMPRRNFAINFRIDI